ncbi:MAG: DNA replication/repair protein RecF [Rhodospirillaceae bacterium]|nr:DNA replication/repair protein RecF [Rhodospirillaceae bacterium]
MMIRPQVASNCKDQQDISSPASCNDVNRLSTDIDAKLNKLRLQTFRNYEIAHLNLESDAVVLVGPNGAGKTNVLEAVSMLAPGRGLRRARREEIAYLVDRQHTEAYCPIPAWSVFADLIGPQGVTSVGTGCFADQSEGARRAVKINGVNAAQADLAQVVTLSWLTPQMDGLFIGSPSARRRFIDRLAIAFDPAHSGRLTRYEKVWRERARLLADGQVDDKWCISLEKILAETGVAISATRTALIEDINRESQNLKSSFPLVRAKLTGQTADWLDDGQPSIEIEDRILYAARQNRLAKASHMPGPHETDLVMTFKGQSAHLASTGEQKALTIAMILAHAVLQDKRLGRPPILLLDDVAAHLDPARRAELFSLCSDISGQVWYSGVDIQAFSALCQTAQFIIVSHGRLFQ